MLHGRLTPLGRELRSVLVSLRSVSTRNVSTILANGADGQRFTTPNNYFAPSSRIASTVTAPATHTGAADVQHDELNSFKPFESKEWEKGSPQRQPTNHELPPTSQHARNPHSRHRINRRTRVDRISEALRVTGRLGVVPDGARSTGKSDISHMNVWSSDGRARYRVNAVRHRDDPVPSLEYAKEIRLSRILASYILHSARRDDRASDKPNEPFHLSQAEEDLLSREDFTLEDVKEWAVIVMKPDSVDLAKALKNRVREQGDSSVPFFLLAYILRRPHIRVRALYTLIRLTRRVLDYRTAPARTSTPLTSNAIFIVFHRLLRHARILWPMLSLSIADLLIEYLPRTLRPTSTHPMGPLHILTYQLNKAMSLFARPTSIEPYKNRIIQEAAIVRILRFMAEHDPPLDVNREGYRAVASIQLGLHKTAREKKWAQVKSLAWPPWKIERTAMDADLTHDTFGISKAAETLRRLQQAGYGHRNWETSAMVSAGWDVDSTPTIQTRALAPVNIGPHYRLYRSGAGIWAARINTTRTAQEAWACYLAFERESRASADHISKKPETTARSHMDVYLAIFKRMYEEEQRVAGARDRAPSRGFLARRILYPGDAREIQPPPFSVHQHTYTSRPPPTVDELYRELRERGVTLEGRCLFFIVANAASLANGLRYLFGSVTRYPEMRCLINLDEGVNFSAIPKPLFAAFVELLCRFSRVPISSALPQGILDRPPSFGNIKAAQMGTTNIDHPLVLACELLNRHRPVYRPTWTSVLSALGHESSLLNLWRLPSATSKPAFKWHNGKRMRVRHTLHKISDDKNLCLGAMTAYRLVRRLHEMMEETQIDIDADGFRAWCNAFENAAVAWWTTMREDQHSKRQVRMQMNQPHYIEATALFGVSRFSTQRLKTHFAVLVGETAKYDEDGARDALGDFNLPRLHDPPSPSTLHAYFRALGWMADYDGLVAAVKWMVEFQTELAEKRSRDRNGDILMRRSITALRVFLERRWLDEHNLGDAGNIEDAAESKDDTPMRFAKPATRLLERLGKPAKQEVIDEVRAMIDGIEGWGGWPSDEEVERYLQHQGFLRLRSKGSGDPMHS